MSSATNTRATFPECHFVLYHRHNLVPGGLDLLSRVHMLVSEKELTLNQPSFDNSN